MPQGLVSIIVASGFLFATTHTLAFAHDGLITHRLSAERANMAATEAVARCARHGYAETAVVVDTDRVRQVVLREDHAGSHSLNGANDEVCRAASFKSDTRAGVERAKTFAALSVQLPRRVLFGDGIVTWINNEVLGAIGAAGAPSANLGEACALA
jgi:uncharacterized protein GlcG (DUF336 family)